MFLYTRAYFQKLIDDFKTAGYLFNVISPLIYIAYLIYAIFLPIGHLWANVTLLLITAFYLVFYLCTYDLKEKSVKHTKKVVNHVYKAIKLSVSGITLGITIYGIYVAAHHTTALSVVLSCFMAIFWVFQVAVESITYFIEYQAALFMAALEADKDNLIKPITAVGDFVKKVAGKEPSEHKEPNKILKVLDKTVEKIKSKKKKFWPFGKSKDEEDETEEAVSK